MTIGLSPQGTSGPAGCSWYSSSTQVVLTIQSTVSALQPHISIDSGTPQQTSSAFLTVSSPRSVNITYTVNFSYKHHLLSQVNGNTRTFTLTDTNTGTTEILNVAGQYSPNSDCSISPARRRPSLSL